LEGLGYILDIVIGIGALVVIIAIVKYGGEALTYALNSFKERGAEFTELSGIVVDYKTQRVFESNGIRSNGMQNYIYVILILKDQTERLNEIVIDIIRDHNTFPLEDHKSPLFPYEHNDTSQDTDRRIESMKNDIGKKRRIRVKKFPNDSLYFKEQLKPL